MTCHGIRPNVRHIGILHLVSILTISPQLTCHSAPVYEILSKSDHPLQKKIDVMSFFKMADLSDLGFYGSNNGFFEKPMCSCSGSATAIRLMSNKTKRSAVTERPRDAFFVCSQLQHTYSAGFLLLVTAASDLLVHKILLNSVLLSPIVSGVVRPKPPGQTPSRS